MGRRLSLDRGGVLFDTYAMLKPTPFHPRTQPLNQAWDWRPWAGYVVASKYEMTHLREYYALRNSAGLLDISPLYKYALEGPDAERLLCRLLVRDIRACRPGQAHYTCWCDEHGYVLEDGVVFRLAEDRFRLTSAEPNEPYLWEQAQGLDVTLQDISEAYAIAAVQGPRAGRVVQQALDDAAGRLAVANLAYFQLTQTTLAGQLVMISRTGYTGDLGYEIWLPAAAAAPVWDHLLAVGEDEGVLPAGMLALDMARIEAGLLLLDVDYTSARYGLIPQQKSTPFDLGFGWMLRHLERDDRAFVGRPALEEERRAGSRWAFVGLSVAWEAYERLYAGMGLPLPGDLTPHRQSVPLYHQGTYVGYATSHTYSPLLKQYIALATLQPQLARPGTRLELEMTVEHERQCVAATVVALPFFNPERKRARMSL